jgi:hypothetical protein
MEIGLLVSADAAKKLADFLLNQVKILEASVPEKKDESTATIKDT